MPPPSRQRPPGLATPRRASPPPSLTPPRPQPPDGAAAIPRCPGICASAALSASGRRVGTTQVGLARGPTRCENSPSLKLLYSRAGRISVTVAEYGSRSITSAARMNGAASTPTLQYRMPFLPPHLLVNV